MANYDLTYEGSRVQGILDTGNSLKDAGYIFRGEATPSTVPGTPTERVAYIGGPGTYTNFGSSITVGAGCICVFKYTGSAWSNQVINTGLDSAVNTLQSAITAINNNIGNGYVYAGVATPSTSPVTGKVFYLAVQAGTYTNFGNAVVTAGLNVIKYNGSAWSVDQVIAIDAEPTQGSANLVKSGGVLNSIIQNGSAFDLSAYNAQGGVLATYADLSAALTALNALPADFKKGGMSMKFVLSSDNKYVQYRLMSNTWSINTADWALCSEDVLVESPEFVCVVTDKEDKILWAIKYDGTVYFGAGVPQQVIDYINEKIAELSLDEYEDIVAFLNDLEKGDKTLQDLLDEKVDKEEGKSLIDTEYANGVRYIENPEFTEVKVDNEDRILEAIMKDGTKLLTAGVKVIGTAEYDGATIKTVENPEFAGVWLDGEDKILFGVEQDGNFLFGCGIPKQVKEYIEQKIEELSLDEYESIVIFIGDYLNNTTLEELLNKKVDGEYVDNPEFIEAKIDEEDKVLEATEKDGTKLFGGDVKVLGSIDINGVTYKVVSNPEWLEVVLDTEDRIICGIKTDGKFVVYIADFLDDIETIKERLKELDAYSVTENPEFMDVELDADDKVLSGRKVDGTKFENNDVELNGNATVGGSLEVDGVVIKNIEDPESRYEITLDSEDKIVAYRKEDGTKVEEKLEVHNITLTSNAIKQLRKDIAVTDWSNKPYIEMDTPKCAIINFSNIATMPTSKTSNAPAYMEFWDMQGNYFKVKTILNAQGDSSLSFTKKNLGIDICTESDNWQGDDTVKIKFGDWVSQDSFHIKAYAPDTFRCSGAICYKLYNQIMETGGVSNDRPYKQYYVNKNSTIDGTGKITQDVETNARCVPDGFPCIVYLNDEFYGVYAFQLKKHRDNYQMKKNNAKHIHLDGTLNVTTIFGGTIDWTAFEVRNPKSLKDIDGNKYDGDNPKELSDSDAFSAQVKSHIVAMSHYMADIREKEQEYIGGTISITEFKDFINSKFDVKSLIDYILFCNVVGNYDGLNKNWQYITYDGVKWFIADYDNDGTFGNDFNGNMLMYPEDTHNGKYNSLLGNNSNIPSYWVYKYYKDELKAKYQVLKEHNVLTTDNIIRLFRDWISAVGVDNYEREYEKWTYQPCYRDPNINTEYWKRASFTEAGNQPPVYDETVAYAVGDFVRVKDAISPVYFVFKCIKANTGQPVLNGLYPSEKPSFGHYDSIYRIKNWLDRRIEIFESMLSEL